MEAGGFEQSVLKVLGELAASITSVALYGPAHPQSLKTLSNLHQDLTQLLATQASIELVILGEELFVQERPFTRASRHAQTILNRLVRKGVEHVSFAAGVTSEELSLFVQELVASEDVPVRSQPHISLGRVELTEEILGGPDQDRARLKKGHVLPIRDRITLIHEVFIAFQTSLPLSVPDLQQVVDSVLAVLEQNPNPLELLAPWEGEERWPAVHAHNTACLVMGMAKLAGLSSDPIRDLGFAALLHDVGKLFAPPEVQERELELWGPELELILDHPADGATALLRIPHLPPISVVVALEHHLHYNGTGYPRLPRPRRPHPAARLVAVADAFSVLHTARGARGLTTRESSIAYLSERAGSVYDPGLVAALQELLLQ